MAIRWLHNNKVLLTADKRPVIAKAIELHLNMNMNYAGGVSSLR